MGNTQEKITIDKMEVTANLYTMKCMRTMMYIAFIAQILNLLNIFIIEDILMYITTVSAVVCWFGAYMVAKYLSAKPCAKYLLFFLMILFITTVHVTITYHTVLISTMPLVCAVQYKNKKFIYYTYALSVVSIFLGVMGGYFYGLCDANMLTLTNTVTNKYIDAATGLLTFTTPNPNPWVTLPLYYVFPRALILYAFVPMLQHVTEVITSHAIREAELKKLSEMDAMTQTYNRNKYQQMIETTYRSAEKIGVTFWDLNGLKIINDTMGHDYGDFAVSAVAGSILENLTDESRVFRMGGDEFVVITENADESMLRDMIRRTNDSLLRKNKVSKVAISAAFGFALGTGKMIESIVAEADANMYVEKQRQKAEK
ncbi:MAG: GGDEF domain-containing protein [Lachnospiraceae bacterium]|nr:GGDEF domain-containing protein [Lachnospiraceae bacterium]